MGGSYRDNVRIGPTEYKYVTEFLRGGRTRIFVGKILDKTKTCLDPKTAAIFVDTVLIKAGKDPINVLKRPNNTGGKT